MALVVRTRLRAARSLYRKHVGRSSGPSRRLATTALGYRSSRRSAKRRAAASAAGRLGAFMPAWRSRLTTFRSALRSLPRMFLHRRGSSPGRLRSARGDGGGRASDRHIFGHAAFGDRGRCLTVCRAVAPAPFQTRRPASPSPLRRPPVDCRSSQYAVASGRSLPWGTSPRVRGKQSDAPPLPSPPRYIPACAGEAIRRAAASIASAVHPRVCGGSNPTRRRFHRLRGTSPRVRGKQSDAPPLPSPPRYIPACAGEAIRRAAASIASAVHPRVCGGSGCTDEAACCDVGTSPRVRGKRDPAPACRTLCGYIPACAGEATCSAGPC